MLLTVVDVVQSVSALRTHTGREMFSVTSTAVVGVGWGVHIVTICGYDFYFNIFVSAVSFIGNPNHFSVSKFDFLLALQERLNVQNIVIILYNIW